jgi:ribosomal protein L11 methyltransferase
MAFGTGQHATTLTCLEAIERLASPPPSAALDIGTGTGILAIALAKLGVRRIFAIDTDPQAIAAARDNLRRNAVTRRVQLSPVTLERVLERRPHACYPLVVANLYVDALVALEPTLATCVGAGGRLIASGVLRSQQRLLRAAFAPSRWRVRDTMRRGSWVTTIFERRPAGASAPSRSSR